MTIEEFIKALQERQDMIDDRGYYVTFSHEKHGTGYEIVAVATFGLDSKMYASQFVEHLSHVGMFELHRYFTDLFNHAADPLKRLRAQKAP